MAAAPELDLSKAPLLAHLLELRRRMLICMAFFSVAFVAAYWVAEPIYAFLLQPLVVAFGADEERRMIYTGLHEAFFTYLKLSFFAALFVSLPLILNQIWKFVAPGLYQHERGAMRGFLIATPVLFVGGAALAFYVVFPMAWQFFLGFESNAAQTGLPVELEARVGEYLGLVIQLILAFGLSFELPVLLMLLARIGVVDSSTLARGRRYAVVATFAVAALITPPDLISQIALGTPVLLLYEISIGLIRWSERRQTIARSLTASSNR